MLNVVRKRLSRFVFVLICSFGCIFFNAQSAEAHGTIAMGDFYTGMIHAIINLESFLVIIALGFWGGQMEKPVPWRMGTAFIVALLAGLVLGLARMKLVFVPNMISLSLIFTGIFIAARG